MKAIKIPFTLLIIAIFSMVTSNTINILQAGSNDE